MSTALRIVILVVEIFAYIAIFLLKNRSLKHKENYVEKDKTFSYRYTEFVVTIVILILGIIFLFPEHIFLSYKKLLSITVFIILSIIWFLNNKLRRDFYEQKTYALMYTYASLAGLAVIIIILISSSSALNPEIFVSFDYDYCSFNVEDELKDIGDAKIAEIVDENGKTDRYVFIFEDDKGREIIETVDSADLQYKFLKYPNNYAYIEKYVYKSVHRFPEMKDSIEESEWLEYRFYINEDLLIKIER